MVGRRKNNMAGLERPFYTVKKLIVWRPIVINDIILFHSPKPVSASGSVCYYNDVVTQSGLYKLAQMPNQYVMVIFLEENLLTRVKY